MLKLSRSDLVLTALGVVGLAVIVLLHQSAFPLVLVEIDVTREEAVANATGFVEGLGAELHDFRHAAIFSGESEALVFLQRTLGDAEAGRWAREEVPIWLWNIRWFRPLQAEEWLAEVGVDGEIVGFVTSSKKLPPVPISTSPQHVRRRRGFSAHAGGICRDSTAVALIVPAAIWAFGHSNYPVFPVYIRGIELTIAGVLFGIAFLHYGLVTCIVAHYVIDAVALGLPLSPAATPPTW